MEIQVLMEFCALSEIGSFSKAADRLNIAQSVLTRHIQKLEQELDCSLFERSTRSVSLNDNGALFLPYARQMVDAYRNYTRVARKSQDFVHRPLRFGLSETFEHSDIHARLFHFSSLYHIPTEFSTGSFEELKALLQQGTLDFVIAYELNQKPDSFSRYTYTRDHVAALLPQRHPLALCDKIHLQQLQDENFILLREDLVIGQLSESLCLQAGFTPHIRHRSKFEDNIVEMIRKGLGVSLLLSSPRRVIGASIVDIEPTCPVCLNLIYYDTKSPLVQTFLQFLKEHRYDGN